MTKRQHGFARKIVKLYLLPTVILFVTLASNVTAQTIPDGTLGNGESVVNSDVPIPEKGISTLVDGGVVQGINLFHSFSEFNVSENGLFFALPNNTKIENVVSRVTGSKPSQILGRIGVIGDANLFLINPNGIIFGPKSSLDLKGSFVATTATAIQFGDQGFFNASVPNAVPLLTVSPSAFFFSRPDTKSITSRSMESAGTRTSLVPEFFPKKELFGLEVPDGKSLLLLGGNVTIDGGGLNALGGRVEIGSVSGAGTVELAVNGSDLHLNIPKSVSRGDITLLNGATVDTSGDKGGVVQLLGKDISLIDGSRIISETSGSLNGSDLIINATHSLKLSDLAVISTTTTGVGNSGSLEITINDLQVKDGSSISTFSLGDGNGGNLNINAANLIELNGTKLVSRLDVNSGLFSSANAKGNGGNIVINQAKDLIIRDGAAISTNSGGIFSVVNKTFVPATGNAGNLKIITTDSVQLFGRKESFIDLSTFGEGKAGNLDIFTKKLIIKDGSSISLVTYGAKPGGNFNAVVTDSTSLNGGGTLSAAALVRATGDAGNIILDTGSLDVNEGSTISVSSPEGKAGSLKVVANSIDLSNGFLIAETGKSGLEDGANIFLNVSKIVKIKSESLVSATAFSEAMGGNITFNTPLLVVFPPTGSEGSDIIAKADKGNGGNILIQAKGVFGIKEQVVREGNQSNDIDASSDFGAPGQVQLNVEADPSKDIVELPSIVVDPNALVSQTPCRRGSNSEFTRSGRGGLPPSLAQDLSHDAAQVGLVEPVAMANQASKHKGNSKVLVQTSSKVQSKLSDSDPAKPILPAQGWVFNSKGEVVLIANNPVPTGIQRLKVVPAGCPVP
jgi:filamentous hemagglutinin family protein